MKPADLKILVQEGEGTTLEFKESLSASLARELVALPTPSAARSCWACATTARWPG